jgi:exopolysaccharide production protein ExoQ
MRQESLATSQMVTAPQVAAPWPAPGRRINRLGMWLAAHAERVFLLYLMLHLSGAYLVPATSQAVYTEDSLTDSIFALLYLVIGGLILLRGRRVLRAALAHRWTLVLLALVPVSAIWSQAPDITIHRAIAILVTCSFGWYLVARYSPREIIQLVVTVLVFTALLSLFYGIWGTGGGGLGGAEWRGAYENKNVFARSMALSATLCLLLLLEPVRWRWLVWAGFGLSCAMVALSRSATGALILIALVLAVRFSGSLRLRATILVPILIVSTLLLAGGLSWLVFNAADLAARIGKDTTLTGRTDLWTVAIMMIQRHPWLGYGFGGFWRGFIGDSGEFWTAVGWPTPHAHNGFIDLTLDLGLVGLAVFLVGLVTALAAAVVRVRSGRTTSAVAPFVLLMFVALYNLTESSILRHNTLYLVLYVVATSVACGGSERARAVYRSLDQRVRLGGTASPWSSGKGRI